MRRLTELRDWMLLSEGGVDRVWLWHKTRLDATADGNPESHFRLALLYERQGGTAAARSHLERIVALGATPDITALAQSALYALDQPLDQLNAHHAFFDTLWNTVADGMREPAAEFSALLRAALDGPDWRVAREAVRALERLGDGDGLGDALACESPLVRLAATTGMRRVWGAASSPVFARALEDANALVQWQAVRHLASSERASETQLLGLVQHDSDVTVRLSAVDGLGRVGTGRAIPLLRTLPDSVDIMGRSLASAARAAIAQIEMRIAPLHRLPERRLVPIHGRAFV